MKTQKELKEIYKNLINDVWQEESMRKYCINKAAYLMELENGEIVEIEKPSIQKHFCFGAGYCGYCTDEEWESANEMSRHAATNHDYFIKENLRKIDEQIESFLKPTVHTWKIAKHYYRQSEENKLGAFVLEYWGENRYPEARPATKEDIKKMVEGLKEVRKQFEKRLHAYLKRYGLSKIETWSYICD